MYMARKDNMHVPGLIESDKEGLPMVRVDSHRLLTSEARIRARVNPYWICGGKSDIKQVFLQVPRFSPVSIISP
jgi:hypothetical protein